MFLLSSLMAAEVESHISLAHRELEWETEKAKVALGKLRRHFLEPLEVRKGCDQIRLASRLTKLETMVGGASQIISAVIYIEKAQLSED
jgi:hypothetical protein